MYPSFPTPSYVSLGNKLAVANVQVKPTITWSEAIPDKYYTLTMVDPDAPSRATPTFRNINHWLVGNIKGNNLNDFTEAKIMVDYRGSGPPVDSGYHRYVFYLFEQKSLIDFSETLIETPRNFSLKDFVVKYELEVPVAGSFFQAQNAQNDVKKIKKF